MKSELENQASEIRGELWQLSAALRGLGMAIGTIAEEREELSVSFTHDQDMSCLIGVLGRYTDRLAHDLDAALTTTQREETD